MPPTRPCWPALSVTCVLACAAHARAEQFIVTDVTYTHSATTTEDSHYRVSPLPATPSNWQSPVDYGQGSAHVRLEVKNKPGATPTKFQICFEGTPSYACTDQSREYTEVGLIEWTTPFANFYKGDGVGVDWSKGVKKVALILKDTMNNKPQGNPLYVPTDLRVEVAILSKGASYMAPPRDAGAGDASVGDAGVPRDAGSALADAGDAGSAQPRDASASQDAAPATSPDASSALPAVDAGARADGGSGPPDVHPNAADAAAQAPADAEGDGQGGCTVAAEARTARHAWLLLGGALLLGVRRRRGAHPGHSERRRARHGCTPKV